MHQQAALLLHLSRRVTCHHMVMTDAVLLIYFIGHSGSVGSVSSKLPVATSKLLLGQPSHASRVLNWQQLLHVGLPVFAGVHKHQPRQQLFSPTVMIMILVQPLPHLST